MRLNLLYILSISSLMLFACKKNKDNPYDDWKSPVKDPVIADKPIDPNTIQGLHKNIFKPTCSNSGCHDGNFEPDFRSVESSYNSLVGRLSTNTDPNNPQFSKRVVAGSAATSMILHRIKTFIPGSQGQMPLSVDPGSDWNQKKDEYIANIEKWINDGAKDQFDNKPGDIDFTPQMGGMIVFADGSATPLPHDGYNSVNLPAGVNSIKIMIAFLDDKTPINNFGNSSINFTLNPYNYSSTEKTLNVAGSSFSAKGVSGTSIPYWHQITLNVSELGLPGDVIWVRTSADDNVNDPVFIPAPSTPFNFKKYFTIKIN
ncbi:MAG TPA: hypothetical protein VGF79_04450 [Bacteroidia bacterium]